jgi:hypothetical protein
MNAALYKYILGLICLLLFHLWGYGQVRSVAHTAWKTYTKKIDNTNVEKAVVWYAPLTNEGTFIYIEGERICQQKFSLSPNNQSFDYRTLGPKTSIAPPEFLKDSSAPILVKSYTGQTLLAFSSIYTEMNGSEPQWLLQQQFDANIYPQHGGKGLRKSIYFYEFDSKQAAWKRTGKIDPAQFGNGEASRISAQGIPTGFELRDLIEDAKTGFRWALVSYVDQASRKVKELLFRSAKPKQTDQWDYICSLSDNFPSDSAVSSRICISPDERLYIFKTTPTQLVSFYSAPNFANMASELIQALSNKKQLYTSAGNSWFKIHRLDLKRAYRIMINQQADLSCQMEWVAGMWRPRILFVAKQKKKSIYISMPFVLSIDEQGSEFAGWGKATFFANKDVLLYNQISVAELKGRRFKGSVFFGSEYIDKQNKQATTTWIGADGAAKNYKYSDSLSDMKLAAGGSFVYNDTLGFFGLYTNSQQSILAFMLPANDTAAMGLGEVNRYHRKRNILVDDDFEAPAEEAFVNIGFGGQSIHPKIEVVHQPAYQLSLTSSKPVPVFLEGGCRFSKGISVYAGLQIMNYFYTPAFSANGLSTKEELSFTRVYQFPLYGSYRLKLYKSRLFVNPFMGVALLKFNEAISNGFYTEGIQSLPSGKKYTYIETPTSKNPLQFRIGVSAEARIYKKLSVFFGYEYIKSLKGSLHTSFSDDFTNATFNPQYTITNTLEGLRWSVGVRMYPQSGVAKFY